jgi:hypothetical protein
MGSVRGRIAMRSRYLIYNSLRAWQRLFRSRISGDYLCLVGNPIDTATRLAWYLPESYVPIYARGQERVAAAEANNGLDPSLRSRHAQQERDRPPGRAHIVYSGGLLRSAAIGFARPATASIVGTQVFAGADGLGYLRVRSRFAPPVSTSTDGWPPADLNIPEAGWAVLAATGPSASDFAYERCAAADIRVVCNSAVRNAALLDQLQPNIVCFSDPVFHFGPSCYARRFRDDLELALERLPQMVAAIPEHYRELLLANYPRLEERVVGFTLKRQPVAVPARRQAAPTRRTGNVLTQHMLPVALQFAPSRISLIGCDGRKPAESYFWEHGSTVQYADDLMQSVSDAHPSFFRDVSYTDYYERHCREVAAWVALAEDQGAQVDTLTPSYIPALAHRLAAPC